MLQLTIRLLILSPITNKGKDEWRWRLLVSIADLIGSLLGSGCINNVIQVFLPAFNGS
jgi:glycerol uptake facilitator-like aquaporin